VLLVGIYVDVDGLAGINTTLAAGLPPHSRGRQAGASAELMSRLGRCGSHSPVGAVPPFPGRRHLPAGDAAKNLCRRGDLQAWLCHQDERRQHERRQASEA